jgi:sugar phosphate isomerase/epimerase
VKRLQPLAAEYADHNVFLAIENHDRLRCGVLAEIVQRLGPDRVGICLDTVNSFGSLEGPDVVVPTLAPYTLCLHAKDFTIRRVSHRMGFVLEGCPAGRGQLNLPWLLDRLQKSPHRFNVILETWVPPADTLDQTIERERAWTEAGKDWCRRSAWFCFSRGAARIPRATPPPLRPPAKSHSPSVSILKRCKRSIGWRASRPSRRN